MSALATHWTVAAQCPPAVLAWPHHSEPARERQGFQPPSLLVRQTSLFLDTETESARAGNVSRSRPRHGRSWSDECLGVLLADYPTNMPVINIATRLGRSKGGVYSKARRLGLRRPARGKNGQEQVNESHSAAMDDVHTPTIQPVISTDVTEATVVTAEDDDRAQPTPPDSPITVTERIVTTTTDEVSAAPTPADNPIVIANEEPKTKSPLLPSSIIYEEPKPRRPYIRTPANGRQTVWFPSATERMIRLWHGNVQDGVIAQVLGQGFTAKAVQRQAYREELPPRTGMTLIRDLEVAREIDRRAAPLPRIIRNHRNKPLRLRQCAGTGIAFYSENSCIYSRQYKETKQYKDKGTVL